MVTTPVITVIEHDTALPAQVQNDEAGRLLMRLGFKAGAVYKIVFDELLSGPEQLCHLDDERVKNLMHVIRKPGGVVVYRSQSLPIGT